jgi:hypothetical protein
MFEKRMKRDISLLRRNLQTAKRMEGPNFDVIDEWDINSQQS